MRNLHVGSGYVNSERIEIKPASQFTTTCQAPCIGTYASCSAPFGKSSKKETSFTLKSSKKSQQTRTEEFTPCREAVFQTAVKKSMPLRKELVNKEKLYSADIWKFCGTVLQDQTSSICNLQEDDADVEFTSKKYARKCPLSHATRSGFLLFL